MKKRLLFTLLISLIAFVGINAQGVSINGSGNAPDVSAILDVSSSTQGILVPRMLGAERIAISTPAEGLLVYQTDGTEGFYYYNGSAWMQLVNGASLSNADGEMYEYNTSGVTTNITVLTAGEFYGWTTATEGVTNGITFDSNSTSDRLTVSNSGDYLVNASISFGTATNNRIVEGSVFKNGVKVDFLSFRRKLSSGDLGVAAITGIISLAATDYIDLRFTSDGTGDVIGVEIINFNISQVN